MSACGPVTRRLPAAVLFAASLCGCHAQQLSSLQVVDRHGMQQLVMSTDKVIMLMHAGQCERAESFAPTLANIAERFPEMAFGKIDVARDNKVRIEGAFEVQTGAPALKAFFRNAPPGKRILEYRGPPTHDAVLDWCNAVSEWDGGDTLPSGWEVGKDAPPDQGVQQSEQSRGREKGRNTKGGAPKAKRRSKDAKEEL